MTAAKRLNRWNGWYDRLPEDWRFQLVLWPLIAIGACNMLLSIGTGFPFGLLVLLAMLCLAAIRLPYVLGWIVPDRAASGEPDAWRFEVGAGWLVDLNRRYDALPEFHGLVMVTVILVLAGAINMSLTIETGFPFGLIFLLVFLTLGALRGPYAAGFLKGAPAGTAVSHDPGYELLPAPAHASDGTAVPLIAATETASRTGHDDAVPVTLALDPGEATPVRAPGARLGGG